MIATKNSFLTEAVLLCKQNCLFFVYICESGVENMRSFISLQFLHYVQDRPFRMTGIHCYDNPSAIDSIFIVLILATGSGIIEPPQMKSMKYSSRSSGGFEQVI